jgi:hypothetical protein
LKLLDNAPKSACFMVIELLLYTNQKEPESLLPQSGGGACRFHENVWLHGDGSAK